MIKTNKLQMVSPCPGLTKQINIPGKLALLASALLISSAIPATADVVAGWNTNALPGGSANYGPSPYAPTASSPNATIGGLIRGSGVLTTGTAAARGWGGVSWSTDATATQAVVTGDIASFTITGNAGYKVSLSSISKFDYRRSGTGPASGTVQCQVGAGGFFDVANVSYSTSASAGGSIAAIDLTGFAALQDVPPGTVIEFRIANYSASGTGTWYIYDVSNSAANDFEISGTVTPVALTPITVSVAPSTFAEDASAPAAFGTVSIPTALGSDLTVDLVSSDTFEATVTPSVIIHAGDTSAPFDVAAVADSTFDPDATVTITASTVTSGFAPGQTNVTVTNVDSPATTVVINKYLNSPDLVELLVIGDGTPGNTTADLRGMIIKDHSASMGSDGGGKYQFSNNAALNNVPAGTLIVLDAGAASTDTDSADWVMRLGLGDTAFFTSLGGTFDIATTELVMIKVAGSGASGGTGAVHSMAGGAPGAQYSTAPVPKLLATGTSGTGLGVIANNSTSALSDFNGSDATGGVPLSAANFGVANNLANNTYIRYLRPQTSLAGTGSATIANDTVGSFQGKNIFPRNTAGQSAAVTVIGNVPGGTLANVNVNVPTEFGTPSGATVGGAGMGTPLVTVSGQVVSVTGLAITETDSATISISGLSTPNPTALTDNGNYPFSVETSGTAEVLASIAVQPNAIVTIPIANLRDVNANGVPLDLGASVAVEGVCTMGNFATTNTSGFIQDGDFGINIFRSSNDLGLIRGNKYVVAGSVLQFSGLTEVSPSSPSSVVDLGASVEPTPLTVTVADLLANAEQYEGRLLQIDNLSKTSGTWGATGVLLTNGGDITVSIQPNVIASEPSYPAQFTGILSQNDGTTPFTGLYRLFPRDQTDIVSQTPVCQFANWAIANGIPGAAASGDDDFDGILNEMEYGLGLNPLGYETTLPQLVPAGSDFTVTFPKGATAGSDAAVTYIIQISTDISDPDGWTGISPTVNNASEISATIPGSLGRAFARLKVVCTQ